MMRERRRLMTIHIRDYLWRIWNGLKGWDVLVGKCPRAVEKNAVILFPLRTTVLNCGLAGIVTIRKTGEKADPSVLERLHHSLGIVEACGLKKLLDKDMTPGGYCGGEKVLEAMERDVLILKREETFEYAFHGDEGCGRLAGLAARLKAFVHGEEELVETRAGNFSTSAMESVNNALVRLKDLLWAMEGDILSNLEKLHLLAGRSATDGLSKEAFRRCRNLNLLLNALDRLEVRGRDSAGVQLSLSLENPGALEGVVADFARKGLLPEWKHRCRQGDLFDGSVRVAGNSLSTGSVNITFTYKKASVTGELGENGRYLRSRISADRLLQGFIDAPLSSEMYLGHTRWASVGSITEENCHPINNFTPAVGNGKGCRHYGEGAWHINVALNGDIDN